MTPHHGMPTRPAHIASRCTGKRGYETWETADRYLSRARHSIKKRARAHSKVEIYRCKCCRQWHVGSTDI